MYSGGIVHESKEINQKYFKVRKPVTRAAGVRTCGDA